jgi:membrane protease YdiL (CAAX protease family)
MGWLAPAGLTRLGGWKSWLIAVLLVAYSAAGSAYAVTGNVDFSYTNPALAGSAVLFLMSHALLEEVVFRAFILQGFVQRWGSSNRDLILSVLVASLIFGFYHIVYLAGEPLPVVLLRIVFSFLLGIFLGTLVLLGKSIYPAVLFHGVLNLAAYLNLTSNGIEGTPFSWLLMCLLMLPLAVYSIYLLRYIPNRTVLSEATMDKAQPGLRRVILIGTPILTGILLLFHPRPIPPDMGQAAQTGGMDVIAALGPVVDQFLAVHVLFAPLLALLGLSVIFLLDGAGGIAARISRVSAFVFVVSYIMYETIVGTAAALLVRGGAGLSPGEQAVISDAVNRIHRDPLLGDGPSALFLIVTLSWPLAVITAAIALRRAGKPPVQCVLLGLSSIFTFHASPLGSLGMVLFYLAVLANERAGSQVAAGVEYETAPFS